MDEETLERWFRITQAALAAGVETVDTIKALFQSSGISDDDAVIDRIVTEGATRAAARDAEVAKPDPPQG